MRGLKAVRLINGGVPLAFASASAAIGSVASAWALPWASLLAAVAVTVTLWRLWTLLIEASAALYEYSDAVHRASTGLPSSGPDAAGRQSK